MKDVFKLGFNNAAVKYEGNPVGQSLYCLDGKPVNPSLFKHWYKYIQKYFRVNEKDFLLDMGCGSGLFIEHFRKRGCKIIGVDISDQIIKRNKIKYPDIQFYVGNLLSYKCDSVKYTKIFCNSVLLYINGLSRAEKGILNLLKILKKEGKLWLGDIPMPNPDLCDKNYIRIEKSTGWKIQHYPPQFFFELARKTDSKCYMYYQEVSGKNSSAYRYDIMLVKK